MTGEAYAFSTTFGIFGIRIGAGTGHQIYHNSVNLYGARSGTATASLLTAAFAVVGTTSSGMDVRNNIFANNITGGTTSIANVSACLPSGGTSAMNLTWNNNSYYFGSDAARRGTGQAGATAGTGFLTTLPLLAAYSSGLSPAATNDNASLSSTGTVPFLTANDLHIRLVLRRSTPVPYWLACWSTSMATRGRTERDMTSVPMSSPTLHLRTRSYCRLRQIRQYLVPHVYVQRNGFGHRDGRKF